MKNSKSPERVVRAPYERHAVHPVLEGESMTHQSHASACDINNIIRRFDNTGVLPPSNREPQYGDVTALQGDPTELILKGRETLQAAGEQLDARQKAERQAQVDLVDEAKRLRAENASLKESVKGGDQPPVTD